MSRQFDLFTTDHVVLQDIPVPNRPPPTPVEDEQPRVLVPDPEVEGNDSVLPDAPALATDTPAPPFCDPDPLGRGHDDLGGPDFEDLARQRLAIRSLLSRPVLSRTVPVVAIDSRLKRGKDGLSGATIFRFSKG